MYVLFVRTRRVVTVLPQKIAKTAAAEYVLGEIPAASPFHARKLYWDHCPHLKPAVLDAGGAPLATVKMKIGDILAREKVFA